MKRVGFEYEVKAKVSFSKWEVDALIEMAPHHYDSACRDLADSAWFGGNHINGPLTQMAWTWNGLGLSEKKLDTEPAEMVLDFRTLDTMVKLLEMTSYFYRNDSIKMEKMATLQFQIVETLREMNIEYRRLKA